jgi:hypothetical protein
MAFAPTVLVLTAVLLESPELGFLTVLFVFVALIMNISVIPRDPALTPRGRTVWLVLVIALGPIMAPLYWWIHVRPAREANVDPPH